MAKIDILDELAQYLDDGSVGTVAQDIFVNKAPDTPNNCISLLSLPGKFANQSRDVKELKFPRFQAYIRDENYNDGADKLQLVRDRLNGMINIVLPVGVDVDADPYFRVLSCFAEQEGGPIGEDQQGRSEFTINFVVEYHYYEPTA